MKIVIFTDTFPPEINGVATSTYNLFNTLKEHGHNPYVVCTNPFDKKITFVNNIIRIPGIELKKIYSYRMSSIYNSKVMKIIRSINPDIIHVHTEFGIGTFGRIAARKLHKPLVYTYHTMFEDYTYYVTKGKGAFDRLAKSFVRKYSKMLANHTTEFISPSEKAKDAVRSYGYDSYINIVPTGIDFSKYNVDNINKDKIEELQEQYDLKDCFTILSLGRVAKEKSIEVCMRGFRNFLKSYKGKTKMLIVGGGPNLIELKELANELEISDSVVFTGPVFQEDIPPFYQLGDVFVSASITETQGLTFMEAMASKVLMLARFDENLADVIYDNETGFYFENEKDFVDKLKHILSLKDKGKQRILNNAANLIDRYSIEKFYNNIMGVYKRAFRKYW